MMSKNDLPSLILSDVFRDCVRDSSEAIMVTDAAGFLVYVNPAWTQVYGYPLEEALGQRPSLLHSGVHQESFYGNMWKQIRDPLIGHWRGELINRTRDGRLIPVLLTITPYRLEEGTIHGYMGIAIDMTEKKQMEERLLQKDRLVSAGLLASGLAHEIGTPMGVIYQRT